MTKQLTLSTCVAERAWSLKGGFQLPLNKLQSTEYMGNSHGIRFKFWFLRRDIWNLFSKSFRRKKEEFCISAFSLTVYRWSKTLLGPKSFMKKYNHWLSSNADSSKYQISFIKLSSSQHILTVTLMLTSIQRKHEEFYERSLETEGKS